MATINEVVQFTHRALEESTTIDEARQKIVQQFPDAEDWLIDESITGTLGGDVIDPSEEPEAGSLRAKFWKEISEGG